jgi:hypothetical protein
MTCFKTLIQLFLRPVPLPPCRPQGVEEIQHLLIVDLGTIWVSGQSHAPSALYPWYPLYRRLGGFQSWSGQWLKEKSFASVGDRTPVVQSADTILTELHQLLLKIKEVFISFENFFVSQGLQVIPLERYFSFLLFLNI